MSYNIVIIGLGALGKRHLSSILNSRLEMNIYCYDINHHALDGFLYDDQFNNKTINMITSIDDIPSKIDFALFAMTSKGRREMFEVLIEKHTVKNVLFEKVLFQTIEDYEYVEKRLKELKIKAWVNCARRQMDCYQNLRSKLKNAGEMQIHISGGEWGLACNAIHFIDLIEFLTNVDNTQVKELDFINNIYESKRSGFKEVYGTIYGYNSKCSNFSITCLKNVSVPIVISIFSDVGNYIVIEGKQKLIYMTKDSGFELREETFEIPYQSQMTQFVLEDILLCGSSRLADFATSSRLHLQYIVPLTKFFNDNGWEEKSCPIT